MDNGVIRRADNGHFVPGQSGNVSTGYQRYADRALELQTRFTSDEILALTANPKKLNKMPVLDVQILNRLAVTLTQIAPKSRRDINQELEAHLDRIEGKATQRIETQTTITLEQMIAQAYSKPTPTLERIKGNVTDAEVIEPSKPISAGPDRLKASKPDRLSGNKVIASVDDLL